MPSLTTVLANGVQQFLAQLAGSIFRMESHWKHLKPAPRFQTDQHMCGHPRFTWGLLENASDCSCWQSRRQALVVMANSDGAVEVQADEASDAMSIEDLSNVKRLTRPNYLLNFWPLNPLLLPGWDARWKTRTDGSNFCKRAPCKLNGSSPGCQNRRRGSEGRENPMATSWAQARCVQAAITGGRSAPAPAAALALNRLSQPMCIGCHLHATCRHRRLIFNCLIGIKALQTHSG